MAFTKFQKVETVTPLKPKEADEARKVAATKALDKPVK
jgi:hypothetical protein